MFLSRYSAGKEVILQNRKITDSLFSTATLHTEEGEQISRHDRLRIIDHAQKIYDDR